MRALRSGPGPARQWAERLDRAGLPYRHEEWTGGHDQVWWARQLPVALGWLLRE
jgi:enterochelin esterase-like enzyme